MNNQHTDTHSLNTTDKTSTFKQKEPSTTRLSSLLFHELPLACYKKRKEIIKNTLQRI